MLTLRIDCAQCAVVNIATCVEILAKLVDCLLQRVILIISRECIISLSLCLCGEMLAWVCGCAGNEKCWLLVFCCMRDLIARSIRCISQYVSARGKSIIVRDAKLHSLILVIMNQLISCYCLLICTAIKLSKFTSTAWRFILNRAAAGSIMA